MTSEPLKIRFQGEVSDIYRHFLYTINCRKILQHIFIDINPPWINLNKTPCRQ